MTSLVSWNMHQLPLLSDVGGADVVLIQEGTADLRTAEGWEVFPAEGEWSTGSAAWRTAIAVRRSSGIHAEPIPLKDLHDAGDGDIGVSRSGTLTAARLTLPEGSSFIAASVYARWEHAQGSSSIYADANAHRILSDLSVLLSGGRNSPEVLVAGDWNLLYGYQESGWPDAWRQRYDTVFERARVLGFNYLGPQEPHGRQADPWPDELPRDSRCVPTFHSSRQSPATATRQLDHVFATQGLAARTSVSAMNGVDEWGRSDHCRVAIEVLRQEA